MCAPYERSEKGVEFNMINYELEGNEINYEI